MFAEPGREPTEAEAGERCDNVRRTNPERSMTAWGQNENPRLSSLCRLRPGADIGCGREHPKGSSAPSFSVSRFTAREHADGDARPPVTFGPTNEKRLSCDARHTRWNLQRLSCGLGGC